MTQTQTKTALTKKQFYDRLKNLKIHDWNCEVVTEAYYGEPDFFEGLDYLAMTVLNEEFPKNAKSPVAEPWHTLYEYMLAANDPIAFPEALQLFDDDLQFALGGVVTSRMSGLEKIKQRSASKKKHPSTQDYIKGLEALGYEFCLNLCTDSVEVNGDRLTDIREAVIRGEMRDRGFGRKSYMEDAYKTTAYNHAYHPVQNYLLSQGWDGKGHIRRLAEHFEDEQEVIELWLRKWLIGAVAKVFEGAFNPMLVLDGGQGIGKSWFARWICPLEDYFIEGPINPDDKDNEIRLAGKWVWEVSELGSTTRKADREALKQFISRARVTVRKPYGRHDIEKPPMASFLGTINSEIGFLYDPTGNRRFLTTTVTDIDWSYADRIDVDDVWAEAHAAYQAGEGWELTPRERALQHELNATYEVEDIVEAAIKENFEITGDPADFVASRRILKVCEADGLRGSQRGNYMRIGSTMTKLGLEKAVRVNPKTGNRANGYLGLKESVKVWLP